MKTGLVLCIALFACGSPTKKTAAPEPGDAVPSSEPIAATPAVKEAAPAEPPAAPKSLYVRLGGIDAITAVVDDFVGRTTTDPRIRDRFFNADPVHLKKMLVELVCMATGGPCTYSGRDMPTAHAGMDLVDEEFGALVENLKGTLDKFKVPAQEQGELLTPLAAMKPQIVVDASKLRPIDAKDLAKVTAFAEKMKDKPTQDLLAMAVIAGGRGQRSYAEQLFTRAEMITGATALASIATTFRSGAPPRIATALRKMPATTEPQPVSVGNSDAEEPAKKPERGSLRGTLKVDGKGPEALGVVMLWPQKGGKKRTPKQRVIEQRGKTFEPHVMAVPVGSTVAFPNFDSVYHNVFSLSKNKAFDLGMYKNGQTRDLTFDKPGIVRLGCNLHASMSAFLIVVDAPHYAVVGPDGAFEFKSLAPGKYKVQAWTERSGEPVTSELTVAAGTNAKDLDLKASAGPAISPDKFGAARQ
jgi:hemoglobin